MTGRLLPALLFVTAAHAQEMSVLHAELRHAESSSTFIALINVEMSDETVAALESGVDIDLAWELEILRPRRWLWPEAIWDAGGRIVLGYGPLSSRYSIRDLDAGTTLYYPSLPLMRSALQKFERSLPPLEPIISAGDVFRFRLHLDIGQLPPPLRLPAYLDEDWALDTRWFELTLH